MALTKVIYAGLSQVTSTNLNDIQDEIIANAAAIAAPYTMTVLPVPGVGSVNAGFTGTNYLAALAGGAISYHQISGIKEGDTINAIRFRGDRNVGTITMSLYNSTDGAGVAVATATLSAGAGWQTQETLALGIAVGALDAFVVRFDLSAINSQVRVMQLDITPVVGP